MHEKEKFTDVNFQLASDGYDLAKAIVALESSPLQRDYVPPEIQKMAHNLLTKLK